MNYTFSPEIDNIDHQLIIESRLFQNWLTKVSAKFNITDIHFSSVDFRFDSKNPLFIKLRATATLPDGKPVHGIVLVRGDAAAVLPVLWCEGKPYLLLVRQPRFAIAQTASLEIPAGILDKSENYRKIALAELEEEAQIKAEDSELIDLTGFWHEQGVNGFAASCGLLDEHIRLFAIERTVTRKELEAMDNKEQTYTEEEEWIRTVVMPYEEASHKFVDGKNLIAMFLYERWLKSQGRSLFN